MVEALQNLLQQTVYGIQIGSIYALIAIGYTMVYGVLKFINFAHGDVYMVGAYIGFFTATLLLPAAVPATQGIAALLLCMLGCAALGAFIERLAYRPLRNGLSKSDAIPWAVFVALYCGLFIGPQFEKHTALNGVGSFFAALLIGFGVALPALHFLFGAIGPRLKPSKSRLTALITAIGISLLLENQGQAIFTPTPQAYQLKPATGAFNPHFGPLVLSFSKGQITVLFAAIALTAMLVYLVRYTRTGQAIRAVSFDPEAAALMGIPTDRIIALTFIIGSTLAGAAGFLNHALTGFSFDANLGITFGLKAFIAAVLGGIGSIEGAVLGALLMGLAEKYVEFTSLSAFSEAIAFVILIAVLLFRPAGLLGKNVVEKV